MSNPSQLQQAEHTLGFTADERGKVRAKLLRWYDSKKRMLPWRGESNPYRIWVSEVMLQQTRVETILERYPRFLIRFPTLKSLSSAPLESILSEWQGLGYYGRAKNLHRAARIITNTHRGNFPRDRDSLRLLPGFGPYIAGAVASIAFGERAAAVDGNVVRVLSRTLDLSEPADTLQGKSILETEAAALVPPSRPGDFNQALMDLGSLVCLPKQPHCHACPVANHCSAHAAGTTALRPIKMKKKPPKIVTVFQVWANRHQTIRLVRRKERGLFGGLWELPGLMVDGLPKSPNEKAFSTLCRTALGQRWGPAEEIVRLTRTLTHRKILFIVIRATESKEKRGRAHSSKDMIWAKDSDISALPLSSAQRAVIDAAREALANGQGN